MTTCTTLDPPEEWERLWELSENVKLQPVPAQEVLFLSPINRIIMKKNAQIEALETSLSYLSEAMEKLHAVEELTPELTQAMVEMEAIDLKKREEIQLLRSDLSSL